MGPSPFEPITCAAIRTSASSSAIEVIRASVDSRDCVRSVLRADADIGRGRGDVGVCHATSGGCGWCGERATAAPPCEYAPGTKGDGSNVEVGRGDADAGRAEPGRQLRADVGCVIGRHVCAERGRDGGAGGGWYGGVGRAPRCSCSMLVSANAVTRRASVRRTANVRATTK